MAELKCENCSYYWYNEDVRRCVCNFPANNTLTPAPCEEDDYNEEPDYDDIPCSVDESDYDFETEPDSAWYGIEMGEG